MSERHPCEYFPALTDQRLSYIAHLFLRARMTALRDTSTELDNAYTRETCAFGREKQAIILEAQRQLLELGSNAWLTISHFGNDLRFKIGNAHCRFSNEKDASNPQKPGVFKKNSCDKIYTQGHLFPVDDHHPQWWAFLIEYTIVADQENDQAVLDADIQFEPTVHVVGYNASDIEVCRWKCSGRAIVIPMHDVASEIPEAIDQSPASIDDLVQDQDKDNKEDTGT
ncbi:hypothetical protein [Chitinimonas lacunae]|uniref:Uncharacterized protein n=1 Tax=Chitinimonas lacunae TaxID=1963018 RepID=A0ABV8MMK7_9NEIS